MEGPIYSRKEPEMLQLTDRKWKNFPLTEIFVFEQGKLKNFAKTMRSEKGISYIAATNRNNGVADFIDVPRELIQKGNCVVFICSGDGAAGYSIYKYEDFVATTGVTAGYNKHLNRYTGTFITTVADKNRGRYGFGYSRSKKRLKRETLKLPVTEGDQPDWEFMGEYMREKEQLLLRPIVEELSKRQAEEIKIERDKIKWKEFLFTEIFELKKGFYNKKPKCSEEGDVPFIGASDSSNGLTGFTDYETISKSSKIGYGKNEPIGKKIFEKNAICVTNNGSVGYAYYQEHFFTCSHDVNPLYLRDRQLNRHLAMFLVTCIEKQRVCFSFAKKWRPKRMVKSKLMLPVDGSGNPAWEYMENCAKNAENKILTEYLSVARGRIS